MAQKNTPTKYKPSKASKIINPIRYKPLAIKRAKVQLLRTLELITELQLHAETLEKILKRK